MARSPPSAARDRPETNLVGTQGLPYHARDSNPPTQMLLKRSSLPAGTVARLAASRAHAGWDSAGWPEVFQQVGDQLECPQVAVKIIRVGPKSLAATARSCALGTTSRCGCGPLVDENNGSTCLALVKYRKLALSPTPSLQRCFEDATRVLLEIDRYARPVDTNTEGWRVLGACRCPARRGDILTFDSKLAHRAPLG